MLEKDYGTSHGTMFFGMNFSYLENWSALVSLLAGQLQNFLLLLQNSAFSAPELLQNINFIAPKLLQSGTFAALEPATRGWSSLPTLLYVPKFRTTKPLPLSDTHIFRSLFRSSCTVRLKSVPRCIGPLWHCEELDAFADDLRFLLFVSSGRAGSI